MLLPPVYDEGAGAAQAATTKRIAGNDLENTEHFVDRRVTLASLLKCDLFDLENSHHAMVFVIEDVAVEHPLPGIIIVANDDPR